MNTFGKNFCVTTFGESHGVALGAVIDGCPAGLELSAEDFKIELDRRRPGQSKIVTPRNEADAPQILSGIFEDKTTGTPIAVAVYNADQRSHDYGKIKDIFRPGHADEVWHDKYGHRDYRGGGRQSGRETLSRVIGGVVAKQILKKTHDTRITAHITQVGDVRAKTYDEDEIENNIVRCADPIAAEAMIAAIQDARTNHDALGAEVKVTIKNPPKNLGGPVFDKIEADMAKAIISIGTTRAFSYGAGSAVISRKASEQNPIREGISGGITTGETIEITIAIKPPPTISQIQKMRTASGEEIDHSVGGRHDPCIAPRFVPVAEAMIACVLADHLLAPPDRMDQIFR